MKKVKQLIRFDLGQGKDYIYHGVHQFKGLHYGDCLNLSEKQKTLYKKRELRIRFKHKCLIINSNFRLKSLMQ